MLDRENGIYKSLLGLNIRSNDYQIKHAQKKGRTTATLPKRY